MLAMKGLNIFETAEVIQLHTVEFGETISKLFQSLLFFICSLQTAESLYILPINLIYNGGWIISITVWY